MEEAKSNEQTSIDEVPAGNSKTQTFQTPLFSSGTSPIDQAQLLVDQLKAENDRTEQLLKMREEIAARDILGGRALAGEPQEKPKEETPQEYAKRILGGGK